jgi:hypothetical protein
MEHPTDELTDTHTDPPTTVVDGPTLRELRRAKDVGMSTDDALGEVDESPVAPPAPSVADETARSGAGEDVTWLRQAVEALLDHHGISLGMAAARYEGGWADAMDEALRGIRAVRAGQRTLSSLERALTALAERDGQE